MARETPAQKKYRLRQNTIAKRLLARLYRNQRLNHPREETEAEILTLSELQEMVVHDGGTDSVEAHRPF